MCIEFWATFVVIIIYKHIARPHLNTFSSLLFLLGYCLILRLGGDYLANLL